MPFPFLSPAALADLTRATIGQALEIAAAAATLPVRVLSALGQAELLVSRITVLADQAELLIGRVSVIVDEAETTVVEARAITSGASVVVREAGGITQAASSVVGEAAGITDAASGISAEAAAVIHQAKAAALDATELLEAYADTLRKGAPLAARFVDELSPEEVTAAIRMVDQLPQLRAHLVDDVMPLLAKLDQVGPDLHKLLEVTEDLRLAIAGIPGLKMLRRRGEDKIEQGD
ncbi:hypothetical protein BJ973_009164 [Actinoplanes tereljensis]|uniref:Ribulose 1,5-bisphosphate carboxylase large subunit n=1 Tax=Paractinoplanes tereljensis TaxID=571912 RepID=A0A919TR93_9ACTN|nr:hypothetical protein [Actinoplanes tereljensis]GIF17872.1 hypothetical protein Ate02nite_06020 [Actinoplanes tereljensis]